MPLLATYVNSKTYRVTLPQGGKCTAKRSYTRTYIGRYVHRQNSSVMIVCVYVCTTPKTCTCIIYSDSRKNVHRIHNSTGRVWLVSAMVKDYDESCNYSFTIICTYTHACMHARMHVHTHTHTWTWWCVPLPVGVLCWASPVGVLVTSRRSGRQCALPPWGPPSRGGAPRPSWVVPAPLPTPCSVAHVLV